MTSNDGPVGKSLMQQWAELDTEQVEAHIDEAAIAYAEWRKTHNEARMSPRELFYFGFCLARIRAVIHCGRGECPGCDPGAACGTRADGSPL